MHTHAGKGTKLHVGLYIVTLATLKRNNFGLF